MLLFDEESFDDDGVLLIPELAVVRILLLLLFDVEADVDDGVLRFDDDDARSPVVAGGGVGAKGSCLVLSAETSLTFLIIIPVDGFFGGFWPAVVGGENIIIVL